MTYYVTRGGNELYGTRHVTDKTEPDGIEACRMAIDAAFDGYYVCDTEGRILEVNDAYVRRSGYTRGELLSMYISDLEAAGSPEKTALHIGKLIQEGRDIFTTRHRTRDGSVWRMEVTAVCRSTGKGLLFAFLREVPDRKHWEKTPQGSEEQFRRLIEYSPISVAVVGLDGGIEYINRKAQETFGYSPEDIPDMDHWWVLAYPDEVYRRVAISTWMGYVEKAFAENAEIQGDEYRVTCKDRTVKTMLISGVPVADKVLVLFNDITLRMKAEQELEAHRNNLEKLVEERTEELSHLNDLLLQSQKMESIGTLAGGVAHDFNNILTAIIGYGHLTLQLMGPEDINRRNIEHILEASERAAHLTKDLLLFSRKQRINRKPFDLNDVITKLVKFLERIIGEDITLETRLSEEPLSVLGDEPQVAQILMNLATNARDAMPAGGTFTLATEQTMLDKEFTASHGLSKPGRYALISIADTGHGMEEGELKRIFEPFYTTKEVGKGTGLGLAVAYGIVQQHEGHIDVYSKPGTGTTFKIYLPLIS